MSDADRQEILRMTKAFARIRLKALREIECLARIRHENLRAINSTK